MHYSEDHTDSEVATILNERGLKTGADGRFPGERMRWFRFAKGFKSLKQRLLDKGWLTTQQYADKLGVHYATIKAWREAHPRPHVQRPRSMAL